MIAVGTPRANGQVERFNKNLTPMLAKLCESPERWDRVLQYVEFAINFTICRSTGETTSKLLFGVDKVGEINDNVRYVVESLAEVNRNLVEDCENPAG